MTEESLIRAINRYLKPNGQMLQTSRGERARVNLGTYYVMDTERNTLMLYHVDINSLYKALQAGELL